MKNAFGSFVNRHNFAAYVEMTIAVPLGLMFVGAVEKTGGCCLSRRLV